VRNRGFPDKAFDWRSSVPPNAVRKAADWDWAGKPGAGHIARLPRPIVGPLTSAFDELTFF
jgi:hypothetical protein